MNKTNLLARANEALEDYQALEKSMRYYENENWHAVNVKRYDDYVDIEKFAKKYPLKYRKAIIDEFDNERINSIYDFWLEHSRESLDDDIENYYLAKDGMAKTLDYITGQRGERHIYFLGRMGGWACFQDKAGEYAENLENLIYDIENNVISNEEERDALLDLEDTTMTVNNAIDEINSLTTFIEDYNRELDFKDELEYRIDEFLEEEKSKENDFNEIQRALDKAKANIHMYLESYFDKELKDKIQIEIKRGFNSLQARLKKLEKSYHS